MFVDVDGRSPVDILFLSPAIAENLILFAESVLAVVGTYISGGLIGGIASKLNDVLTDPIGNASLDEQLIFYTQSITNILAMSASKAISVEADQWNWNMHNHHIVSTNMKNSRGKPVREYLQACGISVEDPRNKVIWLGSITNSFIQKHIVMFCHMPLKQLTHMYLLIRKKNTPLWFWALYAKHC